MSSGAHGSAHAAQRHTRPFCADRRHRFEFRRALLLSVFPVLANAQPLQSRDATSMYSYAEGGDGEALPQPIPVTRQLMA